MKAIYDLQYREEMYERYLEKKDKLPQRFYKLLHAADSDNASSDGRFKIYIDFFEEFLAHLCQLYNSHYYAIDFPKNSSSALTELDNKLLRLSDSSRDSLSFGLYLNLCRAFNHAFSDWTPETLPGFRPEIFCIWHRTYTANVADQETDAYIVHLAHLEKYYKEAVKYKIPSDEIFRYVDDNLVSSKNRFNTDLDKVIGQVIRLRNAENHSREKPWWRKDEDSRKLVLRHLEPAVWSMILDENIFSLLCYEQVQVVRKDTQRKRIYVSRTFPDQRRCMKQLWLDGADLVLPNDTLLWVRGLPFRSMVEDPVLCYGFPLPKAKYAQRVQSFNQLLCWLYLNDGVLQPNELELLLSYGMSDELALFEQPTTKNMLEILSTNRLKLKKMQHELQDQIHQLLSNEISDLDDWSKHFSWISCYEENADKITKFLTQKLTAFKESQAKYLQRQQEEDQEEVQGIDRQIEFIESCMQLSASFAQPRHLHEKLVSLRSLQRAKYIDHLIEQEDKVPIEDLVDDLGLSLEMTKEVLKEIKQDHDAVLIEKGYDFIQTPDLEVVGLIETGPLTALKEKIRKIRKSSGTGLDEDTKQLLEITGRIADVAYQGLEISKVIDLLINQKELKITGSGKSKKLQVRGLPDLCEKTIEHLCEKLGPDNVPRRMLTSPHRYFFNTEDKNPNGTEMNGTEIEIESLNSSLWFNLDIGVEEAVFLLQLLLVEQLNLIPEKKKKDVKLPYSFDIDAPKLKNKQHNFTHMQFCTLAEHLEQVREDVYHKQSLRVKYRLAQADGPVLFIKARSHRSVIRDLLHHLNQPKWGPELNTPIWDHRLLGDTWPVRAGKTRYFLSSYPHHVTGKEFFKPLCVPLQDHLNNAGQYYVFVETNFYKAPLFEMLESHCASLGVELSEMHYDPIIRSHTGEINLALQSLGEGFLLLLKHLEEENLLSGMFDPKESENNTESKSSSILQFSQDGLLKQGRGSTPLLSRKSENSDEQSDSPDTNLVDVGAFQVDLEALNAKVDWACIEALIEHVNFIHDGFFEIVDDNPIELIADEEDVIQEVTFQETSAQPMSIS